MHPSALEFDSKNLALLAGFIHACIHTFIHSFAQTEN